MQRNGNVHHSHATVISAASTATLRPARVEVRACSGVVQVYEVEHLELVEASGVWNATGARRRHKNGSDITFSRPVDRSWPASRVEDVIWWESSR